MHAHALDPALQTQLNEQYTCQLNLKIMSLHAMGTNFEKMK